MGYGRETGGILGQGHLVDGAMFACGGEALGLLPLAEPRSIRFCESKVEL